MKITCNSLTSFLANLNGQEVYNQTVWVERNRTPIEGTAAEVTSYRVSVSASAILVFADEGQALLVYAEDCGLDRTVLPVSSVATDRSKSITMDLTNWCDSHGLIVRPGILDM